MAPKPAPAEEVTTADLLKIFIDQQATIQQILQAQSSLVQSTPAVAPANQQSDIASAVDLLSRALDIFAYDEAAESTFDKWYDRHRSVLEQEAAGLPDDAKVRLVLRKLNYETYIRYANMLKPKKPEDLSFAETKTSLLKFFGPTESQFSKRLQCFHVRRIPGQQDMQAYAAEVNNKVERFDVSSLTADQMKCLVFARGLSSPEDKIYRQLVLEKMQKDPKATIPDLLELCRQYQSMKCDAQLSGEQQPLVVSAVSTKQQKSNPESNDSQDATGSLVPKKTKLICWNCMGPHLRSDCTAPKLRCRLCRRRGHHSQFCEEANRSWKQVTAAMTVPSPIATDVESSRRYARLVINGQEVVFLVDTGADITVIKEETWKQLGAPKLRPYGRTVKTATVATMNLRGAFSCRFRPVGWTKEVEAQCQVAGPEVRLNLLGNSWLDSLGLMDALMKSLQSEQLDGMSKPPGCKIAATISTEVAEGRSEDMVENVIVAQIEDSPCRKLPEEVAVTTKEEPDERIKSQSRKEEGLNKSKKNCGYFYELRSSLATPDGCLRNRDRVMPPKILSPDNSKQFPSKEFAVPCRQKGANKRRRSKLMRGGKDGMPPALKLVDGKKSRTRNPVKRFEVDMVKDEVAEEPLEADVKDGPAGNGPADDGQLSGSAPASGKLDGNGRRCSLRNRPVKDPKSKLYAGKRPLLGPPGLPSGGGVG